MLRSRASHLHTIINSSEVTLAVSLENLDLSVKPNKQYWKRFFSAGSSISFKDGVLLKLWNTDGQLSEKVAILVIQDIPQNVDLLESFFLRSNYATSKACVPPP